MRKLLRSRMRRHRSRCGLIAAQRRISRPRLPPHLLTVVVMLLLLSAGERREAQPPCACAV